ncbi:MAG: FtsQ-type POTRA domain-containing protein [Clostridia bacterium]|nr:FtsQ-type POTRA domain-containing protein [Clostridia bacterium]
MSATKKNSSESYKRKIRQRQILILSIFVVVILLCVCLFTPIFGISQISVTGNTIIASEDIIAASGIENGENVFRISGRKVVKALKKITYIEDAKVRRKFPARIIIDVDEATQDLIFDMPNEFAVATIEGRVLENLSDVTELTAPIVYGIDIKKAEISKKIEAEDEQGLDEHLERLKCFKEAPFWAEIDEFYVSDISNFIMYMKSGMKVTFGSVDNIEGLKRKIKLMSKILEQVTQSERSYLDLTEDKGYYGEYTKAEYEEILRKRQGIEENEGEETEGTEETNNEQTKQQ